MELTGIAAGLLITIGVLVAGAGAVMHHWAAGHQDLLRAAGRRLSQRLGMPGWPAGPDRLPPGSSRVPGQGILALLLLTGLAVVMLAAVGLGKLVDDVTDGDGVAVVDHPIAQFVAAHRVPALTSFMTAVSAACGSSWHGGAGGGGGGAAQCGLAVMGNGGDTGGHRGRSDRADRGVQGHAGLGPPAAGPGRGGRRRLPGFPSGHAAAAAAVCPTVAWLGTLRLASWRARIAVWAVAAMLAVLIGITRVYLGVHWTTDVLGGWIFGILWAAVVMTCWSASGRAGVLRR